MPKTGRIVSRRTGTMTDTTSVLRTRGLRKEFGKAAGLVRAVDGIDLDIAPGETVAVMGPSGCGKPVSGL